MHLPPPLGMAATQRKKSPGICAGGVAASERDVIVEIVLDVGDHRRRVCLRRLADALEGGHLHPSDLVETVLKAADAQLDDRINIGLEQQHPLTALDHTVDRAPS